MALIIIILLIVFSFLIGLIIYSVFKKIGFPKTAKYATFIYAFIILISTICFIFEDDFFSANNGRELINQKGFQLTDNVELVENKTLFSAGEYYHKFILKITNRDRKKAVIKIKKSKNFIEKKLNPESLTSKIYNDDFESNKQINSNYETEKFYVSEFFKPNKNPNYAPSFVRISINKFNNEIIFEDIDE